MSREKDPDGVELFKELWPSLSDAQKQVILSHDSISARNRINSARVRPPNKFQQTYASERIADCFDLAEARAQLEAKQFNLTNTPWGRKHPAISKREIAVWELRVKQLSKGG